MAAVAEQIPSDHGFDRSEMNTEELAGTVHHYEKHVFLCYKDPLSWPPQIETSENDELPRAFAASLKSRKSDTPKKTRLTICEATESDGDVLIFPDMVKYKGLAASNVGSFVDDVLVSEKEWSLEKAEKLEGSYIFVCSHAKRDMRCGTCGPILIETLKKEIVKRALAKSVFVMGCSHIGGHKYAGNVIIYTSNTSDEVSGHWYGYVTPNDVTALLDEHIGNGKIIDKLWRGQMGLSEADQKMYHQKRLSEAPDEKGCCCQTQKLNVTSRVNTECCQNKAKGGKCTQFWNHTLSYFDSWERGDTLAALAVGAAVAAVAFAFSLSRRSS